METIKELLVSDIYLDIIKELGVDNFYKDYQSVEIEELKNRLRQRQFLLEGFNCKVLSEKEMVQFYEQMIQEYGKDIIVWSKKVFCNIATILLRSILMENFQKERKYLRRMYQLQLK